MGQPPATASKPGGPAGRPGSRVAGICGEQVIRPPGPGAEAPGMVRRMVTVSGQPGAHCASRLEQCPVDRAAAGTQAYGQHAGGLAAERDRREHPARSCGRTPRRPGSCSQKFPSASAGLLPRRAAATLADPSDTADTANLQAHVVNRLSPPNAPRSALISRTASAVPRPRAGHAGGREPRRAPGRKIAIHRSTPAIRDPARRHRPARGHPPAWPCLLASSPHSRAHAAITAAGPGFKPAAWSADMPDIRHAAGHMRRTQAFPERGRGAGRAAHKSCQPGRLRGRTQEPGFCDHARARAVRLRRMPTPQGAETSGITTAVSRSLSGEGSVLALLMPTAGARRAAGWTRRGSW